MNRLLRFNPEPFDTELEGAFELYGAPTSESEPETSQFVRPRMRALSRPTSLLARAPSDLPAVDSQALRQRIVRLATQELARWNNGTIKETDPRLRKTLQDYWKTGAGVNYSEDQLGDPGFQNDHPWSAAFISWVMKTAGAGNAFKYSSSHAVYTRAAKDNRIANNDNPVRAYRITELAPQVGDLICKSRSGSGATYDNIRPGMKTHCDIVTEVRPRSILTVGGNVNNSVAQKTLRTDANGTMAEPDYFAVIRIDSQQPSPPVVPSPTPAQPGGISPPRLLRRESTPPGTTLYVEIDLEIVDKFGITAPPVTGIFIPDGFAPGATVDAILYLHGFKAEAIKRQAIDQYWNSQRFPYGAFREGVNASARNVVLVAPTLGSHSEAGSLLRPGGLDAYFEQVLAALRSYGPQSRTGAPSTLGNLILACHSGGGWPMRQLAGGQDRVLARIRECWGFDCTYNRGDDAFWAGWARARPNAKVYIYYIAGSPTAPLAISLRNMRVPNAIVQPSKDKRHNYVPTAYWQERLQGTGFLGSGSGRSTPPVPPSPSRTPRTVPPPGVNYPPPPGYAPSSNSREVRTGRRSQRLASSLSQSQRSQHARNAASIGRAFPGSARCAGGPAANLPRYGEHATDRICDGGGPNGSVALYGARRSRGYRAGSDGGGVSSGTPVTTGRCQPHDREGIHRVCRPKCSARNGGDRCACVRHGCAGYPRDRLGKAHGR